MSSMLSAPPRCNKSVWCGVVGMQLENWSSENGSSSTSHSKPEVLLPVPPGQLEVGQLLLQIIYQKQPQLIGTPRQQLLLLLLLADR